MTAKYRADQVGSFLRPPEVKAAREALAAGKITQGALRAVEAKAILEVSDIQRECGIDVFSDGKLRRGGWSSDFGDAVDGFVPGTPAVRVRFQGGPGGQQPGGKNKK